MALAKRKSKFLQGQFVPVNQHKYKGDVSNIIFRSSWELKFMRELDMNDNIIMWSSEELAIPYFSKAQNKMRKYYPDFIYVYQNNDGSLIKYIIEVKPKSQAEPPKKPRRKTEKSELRYTNECMTWAINNDKWDAAKAFADKYGAKFIVITEDNIFNGLKGRK